MTLVQKFTTLLLASACLVIAGCDSIPFMNNSSDYKTSSRGRPLEVPPDLTSASATDTYSIPGNAATYSEFSKGQATQQQEKLLADPAHSVRLERAGAQRWLVVEAPPEKVWPVVREFWTDMGFAVIVENPQTGVMETEWTQATDLNSDKSYVDKFQNWLDKMGALNNRIKFRTRMENGEQTTSTDVYLTHRMLGAGSVDGKKRTTTPLGVVESNYGDENVQPDTSNEKAPAKNADQAVAEDIDAEMLRRLMVKLGMSEQQSRQTVANTQTVKRASLEKDATGNITLKINDPFDRAWRRVGLALDRIGFIIDDKDRSRGLFYLRYTDVEAAADAGKNPGLLSKLKFWGDDNADNAAAPQKPSGTPDGNEGEAQAADKTATAKSGQQQYRLKLDSAGDSSTLYVLDKAGKRDNSNTAQRILMVLQEQLK